MPSTPNPLHGFQVDRARIRTIGRDLQRPECILAERDGTLRMAKAGAKPGAPIRFEFVERKPGEWVVTKIEPAGATSPAAPAKPAKPRAS